MSGAVVSVVRVDSFTDGECDVEGACGNTIDLTCGKCDVEGACGNTADVSGATGLASVGGTGVVSTSSAGGFDGNDGSFFEVGAVATTGVGRGTNQERNVAVTSG
jgi:hypothetical protein